MIAAVEFRSEQDPEVQPYVHAKDVAVHVVQPSREGEQLRSALLTVLQPLVAQLMARNVSAAGARLRCLAWRVTRGTCSGLVKPREAQQATHLPAGDALPLPPAGLLRQRQPRERSALCAAAGKHASCRPAAERSSLLRAARPDCSPAPRSPTPAEHDGLRAASSQGRAPHARVQTGHVPGGPARPPGQLWRGAGGSKGAVVGGARAGACWLRGGPPRRALRPALSLLCATAPPPVSGAGLPEREVAGGVHARPAHRPPLWAGERRARPPAWPCRRPASSRLPAACCLGTRRARAPDRPAAPHPPLAATAVSPGPGAQRAHRRRQPQAPVPGAAAHPALCGAPLGGHRLPGVAH